MTSPALAPANMDLDPVAVAEIVERFHRDGFAVVPGVLSAEECARLRRRNDEMADDPVIAKSNRHGYSFALASPIDHDLGFAQMFARQPILTLVRGVLGQHVRYAGSTFLRTRQGEAVAFWHVDDCNRIDMPLPPEVPRWPAAARMPVHWLSVQIALTDIDSVEYGPTEIVPGSHYAGRLPDSQDNPRFEGRGPVQVLCKAGDIYLFNHQVWHRGMPNRSTRTRYLMQLQYARGDSLAWRLSAVHSPKLDELLRDQPDLRELLIGPPKYV